jgi:hypothetical protein
MEGSASGREARLVTRSRLQRLCLSVVLVAVTPYVLLKVAWLAGSDVGVAPGGDAAALHAPAVVVANVVTVGLMGLAVLLAVVLSRAGGARLPAWLLVVLGGGAAGLLAHVLIALPAGAALEYLALGRLSSGTGGDLEPWVYALVYPGFALLGLALGVLLVCHALDRWPAIFALPPRITGVPVLVAGVAGLVPFGAAMVWWGVAGVGSTGPVGMTSVVQRVDLIVTGLLCLGAVAAPYLARSLAAGLDARVAWALVWLGCATAALQGPVHLVLAADAHPQPAVAALAVLATPGATLFGLALLSAAGRRADLPSGSVVHDGSPAARSRS